MRKLFLIIAVSTLLISISKGQSDESFAKNIIKLDASKIAIDELGFSYERRITSRISVMLNFTIAPVFRPDDKKGFIRSSTTNFSTTYSKFVKDSISDSFKNSYNYFSPKLKIYVNKNPNMGLYVGGGFFIVSNNVETKKHQRISDPNAGNATLTINETVVLNTDRHAHMSLLIGYNMIFFKNFNVDLSVEALSAPVGGSELNSQVSRIYPNIAIGYAF